MAPPLPAASSESITGSFPSKVRARSARGSANAVAVVAAVEPGGFAKLPEIWYVEKIVAGPAARGGIDLDDTIADNLRRIAFARDARVQDLTVAILDRPRHQDLMEEVAAAGARILTLEEGDIAGAVMAAVPGSGIDAAIGIGGVDATLIARVRSALPRRRAARRGCGRETRRRES